MLSSPFRIVFFGVFLCVAFRIGFCSVFADSRLSAHAGSCRLRLAFVFQLCAGVGGGGWGDNVHANAACVFCFLLLFPMCRISHRFLRCFCRLSTFCTCQLRLAFVFQLCAGVRGGDGGWGVMTSMRMRLLSSVSFVALLLKCCRLLCEALVAASYCFTFETSTMQKPRVFAAFQTKTSKTTQKINLIKARKAWYLRHFRKNATKKQEQKTWGNANTDTSCC